MYIYFSSLYSFISGLQNHSLVVLASRNHPFSYITHHILTLEMLQFCDASLLSVSLVYMTTTNFKSESYVFCKTGGVCVLLVAVSLHVLHDLLTYCLTGTLNTNISIKNRLFKKRKTVCTSIQISTSTLYLKRGTYFQNYACSI